MKDGTPIFGQKALCETCRHATIMRGERSSDCVVYCHFMSERVHFKVLTCDSHEDKTTMTFYEMKQVAWLVDCDNKGTIGFIKPRDLRDRKDLSDEMRDLSDPRDRRG